MTECKLSFNAIKTDTIKFRRRLKKTNPILIDGTMISWLNTIKYLGVNLDTKLWLNTHFIQTVRKAQQTRRTFYPLLNSHSGIPMITKISIYKLYIRSKNIYVGPAWAAQLSNTNWAKLKTLQNISPKLVSRGISGTHNKKFSPYPFNKRRHKVNNPPFVS